MDIFTSLRNVQNEKPEKSFENPFFSQVAKNRFRP